MAPKTSKSSKKKVSFAIGTKQESKQGFAKSLKSFTELPTETKKESKDEFIVVKSTIPKQECPESGGLIKPHPAITTPLTVKQTLSMIGYSTMHKFRLTRSGTLVSGGAGQMSVNLGIYPSLFDQNGALSSLFDLAKIHAVRLTISPLQPLAVTTGLSASNTGSNIAIGFDQGGFAASSSYTYGQTLRLPGTMLKSIYSLPSVWRTRWFKLPADRPFGAWGFVPVIDDPMPSNCGTFTINTETALSNTTTYFGYFVEAVVIVKAQF